MKNFFITILLMHYGLLTIDYSFKSTNNEKNNNIPCTHFVYE